MTVYLDWNATTPRDPRVVAAMNAAEESAWANPSSVHAFGRRARRLVEDAREATARFFGAASADVTFTSGGTEANNLALVGAPALVTSRLEHASVTRVAEALEREGRPVRWLSVESDGRVDPEEADALLAALPLGAVVAVAAVQHETGVIQPLSALAERVHARGGWLHSDTVQAVGKVSREAWHGADSVTLAPHKLRGPKGVGALVSLRPRPPYPPVLLGGGQERGTRPGTQDAVALEGLRATLELALSDLALYAALAPLRDGFERALEGLASVNAVDAPRAPHVSSLYFEGFSGPELVAALDLEGVAVSGGSACSAGTPEPSAGITAMLGRERARGTLRVSLGPSTTPHDLDQALAAFRRVSARR